MLGNAMPEQNKQYVHHVRRIIGLMEAHRPEDKQMKTEDPSYKVCGTCRSSKNRKKGSVLVCNVDKDPVLASSNCRHEPSEYIAECSMLRTIDFILDDGGYETVHDRVRKCKCGGDIYSYEDPECKECSDRGSADHLVQGDAKIYEELGKVHSNEMYAEEMRSPSLLHHVVGICPSCDEALICVSTRRAFGKPNMACECSDPDCGYKENR